MNHSIDNFIGIFSDVYPDGFCKHVVEEFDRLSNTGVGSNRVNSENALKHNKDDYQIFFNMRDLAITKFNGKETQEIFFDGLQKCYDIYTEKFSILKDSRIRSYEIKAQRTDPGGGYHLWHCEQGNGPFSSRVLVYMLYLNSLTSEEAGETEFLYQQKRISPTENNMILWPASYTHVHRGNVVFGNRSKYILTGWFHYEY